MKRLQTGYTLVELTVVLFILLGCGGWIANAVKFINHISDPITGLFVARIVGIFVPQFGAILGFF